MKAGAALVILAVAAVLVPSSEPESLCPPPVPLQSGGDDLRMSEADFLPSEYAKALKYLREVPMRLIDAPDPVRTIRGSEFWISYENSLRVIEGYGLRQEALHAVQRGAGGAKLEQFCGFLAKAEHVD